MDKTPLLPDLILPAQTTVVLPTSQVNPLVHNSIALEVFDKLSVHGKDLTKLQCYDCKGIPKKPVQCG